MWLPPHQSYFHFSQQNHANFKQGFFRGMYKLLASNVTFQYYFVRASDEFTS